MKKVLMLIVFLILVFLPIYFYYTRIYSPTVSKTDEVIQEPAAETSGETVDINFGWPEDWQKHESKLFGYSFAFPSGWYFLGYDEENPGIVAGSHSLTNYDTVKIERYMDHGIIDWQKFQGEKIAIKIDLTVRKLEVPTSDYITTYYKDFTLQPTSSHSFGSEKTFQYNSTEPNNTVRSFVAFPDSERVATAYVFVSNQPNQLILENSDEWNELESIFKTFRF